MSLSDGFENTSLLNAGLSSGYGWDAQRKLIYPTRSQGENYLSEPWPNTNAWGGSVSGTGTRVWISPGAAGTGNNAQNDGVLLDTGATIGSAAWYARVLPVLPKNYGIFMLPALIANSGSMQDSLWLQFQNTIDNKTLVLKLNASGVYVSDASGIDHLLAVHSPAYVCEDWFEVHDNGDGTTHLRLYQGTQLNGELDSFTMPTGNPANAGLVMFQQQSGATAHQKSQMFQINIGDTQLNDDCFLAWNPIAAPYNAQAVDILIKIEDVSADIVVNIDLIADVQLNNGSFQTVHLTEYFPNMADPSATRFMGVLDYTKYARIFGGVLPAPGLLQGQEVLPRVRLINAKMGAFLGFEQHLVSQY